MNKKLIYTTLSFAFVPLLGLAPLTPVDGVAIDLSSLEVVRPGNDLVIVQELPYKPVMTSASNPTLHPELIPQVNTSAPADLDAIFTTYAASNGIDKNTLTSIAKCESGFNPQASNGPHGGMYQFSAGTWSSTRVDMGLDPDPSLRFHAEESIKTAAWKIAHGGQNAWKNCLP